MIHNIVRAICIAFSTYTSIPMPKVRWNDSASRLALGFFPLTGAVICAALVCLNTLSGIFDVGDVLYGTFAAAIPVLITGGIHLDGFCDTVDALSSRRDRQKKLEILKDPNAGAFAVIYCAVYLLLSFGLFAQLRTEGGSIFPAALGYVLSRSLAAINAVTLPNARKNGMLAAFTENSHKTEIIALGSVFGIIACAGIFLGGVKRGIFVLGLCLTVTIWYRKMVQKEFGGATGDTSGFYLQITEFCVLLGVTIGGLI